MDDLVTYPYHAAMVEPPTNTSRDADLHRAWVPPEAYFAQVGWSQWQHGSDLASDPHSHRWAVAPSQPIEDSEQQWAAEIPTYQDDAPGTTGAIWSPLSDGTPFQQQQQQQHPPQYRGGSHYDIEDSWASTTPPTPQLTPTWHHAQTVALDALPAHQAAGSGEKSMAVSSASTSRRSQKAGDQPSETPQTGGWKTFQSPCTNTMATPPRESVTDQLAVTMSSSKRLLPEEPDPLAAAQGPGKKYRVKNRAAAKRCRDKSRQFEIDLSAREKQVTEDHLFLEASAAALREEILTLKNEILQHGDCNCEVIQAYISNVASQVSTVSAYRQEHRR